VSTRRLDVSVAALVLLIAGWQLVAAAGHDGARPWRVVAVIAIAGASLVVGAVAGGRLPVAVPTVVAVVVLVALVTSPDALHGRAAAAPLHYANADAALAVQGVAAACLAVVAARQRSRVVTASLCVLGVALVVVTLLLRSVAADAVMVAVLAVATWAVVRRTAPVRAVAAVALTAVVLCVVVTAAAGAAYKSGHGVTADRIAESTVTVTRVALWHDAVRLIADHPLRGVGPRRFEVASAFARRDPDTRQAHSAYLQAGAEGGVPAMVLLVALVGAVLARLAVTRTAAGAVGAAAVGALTVHASIDYVLQFPAVVAAAGVTAGVAMASRRGSRG
jgi:O-antigen ligase